MTMKRFCATALLLLWSLCALAVQKSGTIVYINGSKFYVHTVQPGETLYGLSKAYEVGEKVILQHNPAAAQVRRVEASVFAFNEASQRVLEKCGFVREAVLKEALSKEGKLYDEVVFRWAGIPR